MRKYKLSPIKNIFDALEVRKIRNECRFFMTNNSSKIGLISQLIWYFKRYEKENRQGRLICYLFKVDNQNVGYGLIRQANSEYWITGGLKFNQRGKRLGEILFKSILNNIQGKDVWLEVLKSNIVAQNLYLNLDFKKINQTEINNRKIIIMKLSR